MADPQDSEAETEAQTQTGAPPPIQMLPANGTQRALFAVVIILGVLIVLALGALVGGFLTGGPKRAANADGPWRQTLDLPAGTRITSAYLDGNRMVVHLTAREGEDVIIVDAATGKELGRLHVTPQPKPRR
jgi:hypothetical protein